MRYPVWVVMLVLAAVVAGGCGGEANRVPDVEGKRLDAAQEVLDERGLEYEVLGGGVLGVLVRSNWEVCEQRPRPGAKAQTVDLVVARDCADPTDDDLDFGDDDVDDWYDDDDDGF
jgi:hypothetical protein